MLSRKETISKLVSDSNSRASYIRAKLNQLIPSQIRALRIEARWSQIQLGAAADMKQSRISASESGMANFSIETLIRLAASFKVGLQVKFVPYSEMLEWEKQFSQDTFTVAKIEEDQKFLSPNTRLTTENKMVSAGSCAMNEIAQSNQNAPLICGMGDSPVYMASAGGM